MSGREESVSGPVIIAIDGPAGSGKSTTARALAQRLGVDYIDTGALYRALTWWAIRAGIAGDRGEIARRCGEPHIECGYGSAGLEVRVDGHDVSAAIRDADVTAAVSAVSAIPEVRHRLVDMQRTWARQSPLGAVVEGRDIGTVVFPDATVKVYLDADPAVRAHRRHAEHRPGDAGDADAIERTRADLLRRDALDSTRPTSPLTVADDAVRIDSSGMGVDDVVSAIVALIGTP
jgi:cytidylate kinase